MIGIHIFSSHKTPACHTYSNDIIYSDLESHVYNYASLDLRNGRLSSVITQSL